MIYVEYMATLTSPLRPMHVYVGCQILPETPRCRSIELKGMVLEISMETGFYCIIHTIKESDTVYPRHIPRRNWEDQIEYTKRKVQRLIKEIMS
jgi:hypothetical protein